MEINTEKSMEQLILDTAEQLFLEKGFASTSTTQIAKVVGCNQALIHYYFRTKENLFNSIFESKFKMLFHRVFDTTQLTNLSFTDKIKHIVESHFDILSDNPKMPMLILNELSRQPDQIKILKERLHELPEKLISIMNKELAIEIAAGRIRNCTFLDIMLTIISLNLALFTMLPIAVNVAELNDLQTKFLLAHRRSENVNIVLSYLRP
ncbi:MAG: TetR/AcrR family transcriptional regulator [Paludibacter sp.]